MRIIGGKFKGRKLRSVRGASTRPTSDRTREAIFNIIGQEVRGSRVLDLYAGTGALGIEALSRGAQSAAFIDVSRQSLSVIEANLAALALEVPLSIIRWDLTRNLNCLCSRPRAFDLVFMDPPYNHKLVTPTLNQLHASRSLDSGALVIVEHSKQESFESNVGPFKTVDQRRYGKTLVSFFNYMV